jgi:hypoxia up-regulated 1
MSPPGRRRFTISTTTVILGLLFLFSSTASAASAVLGIDFGTEYIKAAIVKPGIPLEIVLTKDSKRKEASAVAFKPPKSGPKNGTFPERVYGADAVALSARFPGDVYSNIKPLLGVPYEAVAVKEYAMRHPAIEVVKREDRPTVGFKSKSFIEQEQDFSVEEILAMELQNIKANALAMAGKGTDVSEVVFTIPSYYTADERRALEVAANLAGLKVLGLITDGLAVGLNYATSRSFPDVTNGTNKPEYHMVFDMGAGSTTATVLRFQSRQIKDVGRFNKTVQEVAVLGTGWDRTLGGDSLNGIIIDDMVAKFVETNAAKKVEATPEAVKKHGRAATRLWRDAEKLRQVLSANTESIANFESLYEDVDFKYKLTRANFETMAVDFATRVDGPIIQALASAGLQWTDLESVILHGGASRTPFIQKRLESLAGGSDKLRASVNADEAAVMGAAFKAAGLSPSFRVKDIRTADTATYPVGVQWMWNLKDRLQQLFNPTSAMGVIKEVPFTMYGEFDFTLYQTVPHDEEQARAPIVHARTGNLTRVVTEFVESGCIVEDVKTKFAVQMDPRLGLPEVLKGWVHCDMIEPEKPGAFEGVKNFLGFGSKKEGQEPLKESDDPAASKSSSDSESSSTKKDTSAEETPAAKEAETPVALPEAKEGKDAKDAKDTEAPKPKKKTLSSAITFHLTQKGYEKHPRPELKRMRTRYDIFSSHLDAIC